MKQLKTRFEVKIHTIFGKLDLEILEVIIDLNGLDQNALDKIMNWCPELAKKRLEA